MEAIPIELIIGIIALFGGFLFGRRSGTKAALPSLSQTLHTQVIDRVNFLQTLRRELANILIWRNPQRYLQLYRRIHADVSSLQSWRPDEVRKGLEELCKNYSNYSDFDAIAAREYVLYADAVSMMEDDELERRYRDIVMFAALSATADEAWKDAARTMFVHTTSDKELAHLTRYVQRIEDTKLWLRINRAMDDNALAKRDDGPELNNDHYTITHLPHLAEIRYGVHLKHTNEFSICSFFVFDDGRIRQEFYRTDPTFQTEQPLDPLHDVLKEVELKR